MVTTQTAFNSLNRVKEYTQQQLDSDASLYSKGVENLKQIRELAEQIMLLSNQALSKVDEDDPKYMVKSDNSVDIVEVATKAATEAVMNVLVQLNIIGEQHIHADKVVQYNVVAKEDTEEKPVKKVKPNSIIHKYKEITSEVSDISEDMYSDETIYQCAQLCKEYFQVRFNSKYDLNRLHKFDKKQFRNYLASIVISYSDAYINENLVEYLDNFYQWIEDVKTGTVPYTLPKPAASIFFSIIKNEKLDIDILSIEYSKEVWNELWILGLNGVVSDDELDPSFNLSWIFDYPISDIFDGCYEVISKELDRSLDASKYELLKSTWIKYFMLSKSYNYFDRWSSILNYNPEIYDLIDKESRVILPEVSANAVIYASLKPTGSGVNSVIGDLCNFNSNVKHSSDYKIELIDEYSDYSNYIEFIED